MTTESLITTIVADHAAQTAAARLTGTFGDRLPYVRTQAGLSQSKLAHYMHTKRSTIGRIEQGQSIPKLRTMQRIVAVMAPLTDVSALIEVMVPEQENPTAQVVKLTAQLDKMTARYAATLSRNEELRQEIDQLRLKLPAETTYAMRGGISDEDEPFPNIDPELVELRRLITALREADHETFAPAVCWALNNVKVITAGLRDATGKVRIPVRRRAA